MERIKSSVITLIFILFFVVISACKKNNSSHALLSPHKKASKGHPTHFHEDLLLLIPKKHYDVLYIPRLGNIPPKLGAFLSTFEGTKKDTPLRSIVNSLQSQLGIPLLDKKSIEKQGLYLNGGLIASRLKFNQRRTGILAVHTKDTETFEKRIRALAQQKLLVKEFKKTERPKYSVFTAYGQSVKKQPIEEFSYTIKNKTIILVVDLGEISPDARKNTHYTKWSAKALEGLLSLPSSESLLESKMFHEALQKNVNNEFIHFRHRQEDLSNKKNEASKENNLTLREILRHPESLMSLSSRLPWLWTSTALSLSKSKLMFRSYQEIHSSVSRQLEKLATPHGTPEKLSSSLHKDAIAVLKASLAPQQIDVLFQKAMASFKAKPLKIYELIKKYTGLDLPKEVLPALEGHAYVTLYEVNPDIILHAKKRHPLMLFDDLHLTVVALIKEKPKAKEMLQRLANTFKIGTSKINQETKKDGQIFYSMSIPAWRNQKAYWTLYDNYFLYSVGKKGMAKTLQALKDRKARMFQVNQAGALSSPHGGAFYVNVHNLLETVKEMNLSWSIKAVLFRFLEQANHMKSLFVSLEPSQKGIETKGEIRLQ